MYPFIKVTLKNWKNKRGTSDSRCECGCGSWKDHWTQCSGEVWPPKCSVEGCDDTATVGAYIVNPKVPCDMIIPTCHSCSMREGKFDLVKDVWVVPADRATKCTELDKAV